MASLNRNNSHNNERADENQLLKDYFKDLKKHPPLTKEEEILLLKQVKEGNERAKKRLIVANLRFVVAVAKRYRHINEVPFEDLIAVGNLGLMRAAQRFDVDKNVRFISYAVWWIRQAMIQVVSSHGNPIRLPLNRIHTGLRIRKVEETLIKKLNRRPTLEELAEGVMMKPQDLSKFLREIPNVISMDSTAVDADEDLFLRDVITDNESDPLAEAEKKALDGELEKLLDSLNERERIVVMHRFGLGDLKPYTLEEIGKLLGVTRERVRQIEVQALEKLRNPRRSEVLQNYIN
ncbi:MAG: RNA polymerase sigma factor RpoD/SigA [Candidatus Riflebacteria bacterium]|nr:RNA polymerase sigma factor RpoD/SigA [Candidatus Riflebacteria bacterium]NLV95569.1 sigma-70 family RNA polymerase sigma factor [Candidatus Riflebacteria bacterium]